MMPDQTLGVTPHDSHEMIPNDQGGFTERTQPVADVVVTAPIMNPAEWGLFAICYMQVCAHGECPPERIEQRANELNPAGSDSRWRLTTEHPHPQGEPLLPVQCADDPARLHHMLCC